METIALIPARYGSTRFPGKPLAELAGKPMIQLVWEAAISAKSVSGVNIVTDDKRIKKRAAAFGAEAVLTSEDFASGTDRIASVVRHLYPSDRPEIIINVQGDEPLLTGDILDKLVEDFVSSCAPIGTIVAPATEAEIFDPNTVKVVTDITGNALYFSRSPIPFSQKLPKKRAKDRLTYLKHIGIYAFRTHALLDFSRLKPTPLEMAEGLEQLRVIENGWDIRCTFIAEAAELIGVDTEEDLIAAEKLLLERQK